MFSKSKKVSRFSQGFTLIELMVVIVIIGILVAVALPNFISAQDRARISNVKTNMHVLQLSVETYSVDNNSKYPDDLNMLKTEGDVKGYWKEFKNPFLGVSGLGKSYIGNSISTESDLNLPGIVGYQTVTQGNTVSYYLYGAGKDAGLFIKDGNKDFYLTQR